MEVVDRETGDSPAEFRVDIENNFTQEMRFRLSVSSSKSSWFYVPTSSQTLGPGETGEFQVMVSSPEDAIQDNYGFTAHISASETDYRRSLQDYFSVRAPYKLFIDSISVENRNLEPEDSIEVDATIVNTGQNPRENYKLRLESDHFDLEKEGLPIESGQLQSYTFSEEVGNIKPGDYTGSITVIEDDGTQHTDHFSYSIDEVENVEVSREENDYILLNEVKLSARNSGNINSTGAVSAQIPSYLEPVTFVDDKPSSRTSTGRDTLLSWEEDLEPSEEFTASYSVNMWIPVLVLTGIVGGLAGWKRLQRDLILEKTASLTEDGVKVHIELENRSDHPHENIEIKDFIPDIASVNQDFPFAKPVIRKTSNGTKLTWSIEELSSGDQRVFEYIINPQVEVESSVTLPAAEIVSDGRKLKESSEPETEFQP